MLHTIESLQRANALTPCQYKLSAIRHTYGPSGGSAVIGVQVPSGCSWKPIATTTWMSITKRLSGSGNGKFTYFVGPNTTGHAPAAIVLVGDQLMNVTQLGQ